VRIILIISICLGITCKSYSQLYVLKDHRPDSNKITQLLFDSLEVMIDSFYIQLKYEDIGSIKKFVPTRKHLRATFDTLDVEYNENKVVVRQQMVLRGLQKDYHKILKKNKKAKVRFKTLTKKNIIYNYGVDKDGNEFCYITIELKKRKKEYELKFLAIRLIDKWFIGDELMFERVD
jgi:hypothetical protein